MQPGEYWRLNGWVDIHGACWLFFKGDAFRLESWLEVLIQSVCAQAVFRNGSMRFGDYSVI